jgi:integrase
VRVSGEDRSQSFRTKAEAVAWAAQQEGAAYSGKVGKIPDRPFRDLIERYIAEVLPKNRGERPERLRLQRLLRDDALSSVRLPNMGPEHFAAWRDRRLQKVSSASVLREWNSLSAACNVAAREWRWLRENPMRGVKRPTSPPPRVRIYQSDEIERVLLACGYSPNETPRTEQARIGAAVVWALETAMRAGEIVGLTWGNVDTTRRIAHLPMTKNGTARDVPLSTRALALLDQLRGIDPNSVFAIRNVGVLDALWRKARDRAMLADAHFHDLRATAITRMAPKVTVLELAKISGHKDLRILQSVYYREDPANIADKLG